MAQFLLSQHNKVSAVSFCYIQRYPDTENTEFFLLKHFVGRINQRNYFQEQWCPAKDQVQEDWSRVLQSP